MLTGSRLGFHCVGFVFCGPAFDLALADLLNDTVPTASVCLMSPTSKQPWGEVMLRIWSIIAYWSIGQFTPIHDVNKGGLIWSVSRNIFPINLGRIYSVKIPKSSVILAGFYDYWIPWDDLDDG